MCGNSDPGHPECGGTPCPGFPDGSPSPSERYTGSGQHGLRLSRNATDSSQPGKYAAHGTPRLWGNLPLLRRSAPPRTAAPGETASAIPPLQFLHFFSPSSAAHSPVSAGRSRSAALPLCLGTVAPPNVGHAGPPSPPPPSPGTFSPSSAGFAPLSDVPVPHPQAALRRPGRTVPLSAVLPWYDCVS